MEINIGDIFESNSSGKFKIIGKSNKKCGTNFYYKIQFLNPPFTETEYKKCHILSGQVQDYNQPSVKGIGSLGYGKYSSKNKEIWSVWYGMLQRCTNINNFAYKDISISNQFLIFQNFAAWYEEQSKWNTKYYLELDKDILFNINHLDFKIYSPETCLLIPSELNQFLTGDNLNSGIRYRKSKKNKDEIIGFLSYCKGIYIGDSKNFWELKLKYAKYKKERWIELIDKFELPINLKEILLKYDFSWSWLNCEVKEIK